MWVNNIENRIGEKFGFLTIIDIEKNTKGSGRHHYAICKCDCGIIKKVRSDAIKNGCTVSCTCKQRELLSEKLSTHRKSYTNTYKSYHQMLQRCYNQKNKNYRNYGGRGIQICQSWRDSFINFLNDMGECPPQYSIERVDVNGNYEPTNCKWIHKKDQSKNRRPYKQKRRIKSGVLT